MKIKEDDEIYMLTGEDMDIIKELAKKILVGLPDEPKTALVTVAYLKQLIEETLNRKVKAIKVIEKGRDKNE